jgi:hypothetical protein
MISFIFIFGRFIMARATLIIAPKPVSTAAIEASPTPLQTPALYKSDRFTGVAIGLTVLGCVIAVFTMTGLVLLCCSATRRRSNEGGLGDVELQQSQTANAPAQTPTQSQPEQQNALPEVSQMQPGCSGSFEKWKTQRDSRQKEHKEWMRKKRAEMAVLRRSGRALP